LVDPSVCSHDEILLNLLTSKTGYIAITSRLGSSNHLVLLENKRKEDGRKRKKDYGVLRGSLFWYNDSCFQNISKTFQPIFQAVVKWLPIG
jgi:hypothetical protein